MSKPPLPLPISLKQLFFGAFGTNVLTMCCSRSHFQINGTIVEYLSNILFVFFEPIFHAQHF